MKRKQTVWQSALIVLLSLSLSSCQVIEGIFKAGMGFGIFLVVALIGLLIYIVMKIFQK
jgi:hypothetical protein